MRDVPFDIPVTIETAYPGRYMTLTRLGQAADYLMNSWPDDKGPKHREALQAIMDVLEQRKKVDVARKAFLAAAKESGVFVRE